MAKRVCTRMLPLDSPAFGRTAAIVRDRRHVADCSDVQTHRLQRAKRGFAARTRTAYLDFERTHAGLDRLLGGIFGGDLRGVRGRFARTLETERAGRRPRDGIALPIGDRYDRVVE